MVYDRGVFQQNVSILKILIRRVILSFKFSVFIIDSTPKLPGGLQSASGTRFAMTKVKRRTVTLRLHRNPQSLLVEISRKEG